MIPEAVKQAMVKQCSSDKAPLNDENLSTKQKLYGGSRFT